MYTERTQHTIAMTGACVAAFLISALASGCGPKYPKCDKDKDCEEGEYCVNGMCQMCRDSGDCGPGQQCNEGRCEMRQGYCESDADCPSGQTCRNNQCSAALASKPKRIKQQRTSGCSLETVFFEFDSDTLDSGARDALQNNAKCIKQKKMGQVHLTGHADPRGTEEYNLALGDRRARSVLEYVNSLGVGQGSLSASSVGEEMAGGTDEGSWSQDRKVEFTRK